MDKTNEEIKREMEKAKQKYLAAVLDHDIAQLTSGEKVLSDFPAKRQAVLTKELNRRAQRQDSFDQFLDQIVSDNPGYADAPTQEQTEALLFKNELDRDISAVYLGTKTKDDFTPERWALMQEFADFSQKPWWADKRDTPVFLDLSDQQPDKSVVAASPIT